VLLLRVRVLRRFVRLLPTLAIPRYRGEDAMSHVTIFRGVVGFFEHALMIGLGFVLMVVGLGLGVTMIMLPVGVVIGLVGVALFVTGLFARFDHM